VAFLLDDPQRQPSAPEPRWAQGRRPPGVKRVGRDLDDGALSRRAAPAGPGGGEAACKPRLPRHRILAGPPVAGQAAILPGTGRRPILSLAHQGWRRCRLLHRLGRAGGRHHQLRRAGAGLCAAQGPGAGEPAARPHGGGGRRRRARRGQCLRGHARGLEARCTQSLVGDRLQPPEPRRRGQRPAVQPHRRAVQHHGLARRHPQIRQEARGRLCRARWRGAARVDRCLPQFALLGAGVQGRRGLAQAP
jgi:hypothetical protein